VVAIRIACSQTPLLAGAPEGHKRGWGVVIKITAKLLNIDPPTLALPLRGRGNPAI